MIISKVCVGDYVRSQISRTSIISGEVVKLIGDHCAIVKVIDREILVDLRFWEKVSRT